MLGGACRRPMAFAASAGIIRRMLARCAAVAVCSMTWLACGGTESTPGSFGSAGGAGAPVTTAPDSSESPTSAAPEVSASPSGFESPSASETPGELPLSSNEPDEAGQSGAERADASAPGAGGGPVTSEEPSPPGELGPITIWIAGDSTVANGQTPCPRGWGGAFAPQFNDLVSVVNSAAGGRSVHTWLYNVQTVMGDDGECLLERDSRGEPTLQPRWQAMLDGMKAGDYLFVQFGINDGDRTCDRHVGVPAFETALEMMARAAQERGAHPIFLTPVSMVACNGSTARGSRGEFVPATLRAGEAAGAPVIDLHERSVALYQELGFCPIPGGDVSAQTGGPVGDFFCDDHTHFSSTGAARMAELVSAALVEQGIPLAAYLR